MCMAYIGYTIRYQNGDLCGVVRIPAPTNPRERRFQYRICRREGRGKKITNRYVSGKKL